MDHVEAEFDRLVAVRRLEPSLARRPVDCHQIVIEVEPSLVALDIGHQCRDIVLDAEQDAASIAEMNVDAVKTALSIPVVGGQIHGFLRRAGAFDRHWRLGKDGAAALEVLYQAPGIGREIIAVVRRDAVLAERFDQAFDLVPVELEPRADDEVVVFDDLAAIQDHRILFRLEGGDAGLDPADAGRDQRCHGPHGILGIENTGTDQRPARLIVVDIGRIDDGDIQARLARQEARGNRDACRAATDDHHRVGDVGPVGRRAPAIGDAAHDPDMS